MNMFTTQCNFLRRKEEKKGKQKGEDKISENFFWPFQRAIKMMTKPKRAQQK